LRWSVDWQDQTDPRRTNAIGGFTGRRIDDPNVHSRKWMTLCRATIE
jgi:hypothetical protein